MNETQTDYSGAWCVHELFEIQVERTPAAEAAAFGGERLAYRELNRRANQLAHHLRALGVKPEARVGVCVTPSLETAVGLLGILKAGGAYVPLEPAYPRAQLASMLRDAGVEALLTVERLAALLPDRGAQVVRLDSDWEAIARASEENPASGATAGSLAYVTYSSGRGIPVEHRSVCNRLQWLQEELALSGADVVLHRASLAQDTSVWEVFWPLTCGGRLVVADAAGRDDAEYLRHLVVEQSVSVVHLSPAELCAFVESRERDSPDTWGALRWVLCGGEPLQQAIVDAFLARFACGLYNLYGPPEAGTEVTAQLCQPGGARPVLPVGYPISNLSVCILDRYRQLAPMGVTGEVYIAGEELARGYLNDPEETGRRFVENPFAELSGERLFRTGDLGRWLSDGALELVGRADRQVWVRGYRIELGEVEAALLQDPSVDGCVVLAKETETGGRALVAYVVPAGSFSPERLRAHVETALPAYMWPRDYVGVSSLPLTARGEVDEQALAGLAVLDADVVQQWEARLRSAPEVEQAAVVIKARDERLPLLHLSELLPDWKGISASAAEESEATSVRPAAVQQESGPRRLAVSEGGPLRREADAPTTLPEALRRAAVQAPDKGIVYVQSDGSEIYQSYAALLADAERILAGLRGLGLKPQDKVIFQLDLNQDFIPAFWGCVLGGFIPVPISIPPTYEQLHSTISKLHNAWEMLGHPIVLTGSQLAQAVRSLSTFLSLEGLQVETIDVLRANEPDRDWHANQPGDLALLLLTSGSTGLPKAVTQTHQSILSRTVGTAQMNGHSSRDTSLNWMPIDHVGGIVMFHVRDVYLCCRQVHVPTHVILQEPLKWLDLIEHYRATITWAPNFAYGLVNDRAEEIARRRWDLSSLRFILNAGEAIVAKTARRFLALLHPHGLRATAMYPCWGMSETCSGVVYSHSFLVETTADQDQFVEVGAPIPGFAVRIVDAQDQAIEERAIGRLQVKGPEVTCGYYQNPELNREVFTEDAWFKTGDLGFLRNGCLTITGREKDIIIIRGINYYSHEIEAVVEEVEGVEVSFTAACAVRESDSDTDKLAIFFNTPVSDEKGLVELIKEIRGQVVRKVGVKPEYLIPVEKEVIPKTEIGKIQRLHLRRRFEAGEFDDILMRVDILSGSANTLPDWFYRKVWCRKEAVTLSSRPGEGRCLVFLDRLGLGARLCTEMGRLGQRYVSVEAGEELVRFGSDRYRIDPRQPEHYRRLLASLSEDGVRIDHVLHLWTYDKYAGEIEGLAALEQAQDRGLYSVLFLAQALALAQDTERSVRLHVISSHTQPALPGDEVACERAPVLGLTKTIPQEMPWVNCRHVDLPMGEVEENVAYILQEMRALPREREIAYRNGQRWVARLEKVDLRQEEKQALPFEPGGMYVLSGGLGGIGVEIARYLLERYRARLLLLGRTPLPERGAWEAHLEQGDAIAERIKALLALEQLRGEIVYEAVDVCDFDRLQQVVERAKSHWGCEVDGVIHLAGIFQERLLVEETRDSVAEVLRAKVGGTWGLHQLLKDRPQGAFVSFSSVNGFFGGATVGAYAAANSFLDSFSYYQRHQCSLRSYCLAWSMWDEVGMSRGYQMKDLTLARGYCAVTVEQGLHSLLASLYHGQAQLLVGLDGSNQHIRRYVAGKCQPLQELTAYFTFQADAKSPGRLPELRVQDRFQMPSTCEFLQIQEMPLTPEGKVDRAALLVQGDLRPQLSAAHVAPQTDVEQAIAAIWQELLHVEKVSTHDNFFDLGADSFLIVQFHSKLREALGRDLQAVEMFKYPTISSLAAYLSQTPDEQSLQESHDRAEARRRAIVQRQRGQRGAS